MTTTVSSKRSWLYTLGTGGKFALLGLAALLTIGPVVWTLITALSPTDPVTQEVSVGFDAFADVFAKIPIWLYAWNSALVVVLVAAGQMLSAAMAGYVFAKFEFRSKKLLFALILATMMVPLQVTIVPVFMLVRGMGLADTLLALIVPALPTAFGTFLMRQYFMGIPTELGEAAQLDGAGPWRTFFGVYLPLATPGLAIVGILAFNYHWNEFFRPLIMTISEQNFTLPLGLVTLQGNLGTGSVSTVLAGVILSMIPALLVFFFGQKPLREGLTAGVGK
ncbi:sugar ABC transporter permease [Microbacterium sp. 1.5R]|uniref:carbohydrate ABC transporter permease n=1 Tax=unclassified Microbacterium TaxID=2609290 RepID=UPI0006FDF78F|nr:MULTISPECIES: carbohydrate ABC transporter permease [unclassified Microbacterium]APH43738.1 sugar ABC transporter permease [Microbacterium sp. 1.5R]KRD54006.1 sugar ABC transporter permease [Microbacterium sp. Root280D1]MBC6493497.1 sugar ABC transporter permease [Microbacterium sp. 4-7]MDY0984054.1 carbohydrate ABC transporter permease [Microbacterium sp. CFBP9023]CAH0198156.1 Lactose transport system permease protein LacG [Microbacterium sp. Bi98]